MILHKQQQEALGNQVKALTNEKKEKEKEKENALIDLELLNLKNVVQLNFEKLRRKIIEVEKEKLMEEKEY